jgi:hypothetical protein
MTYAVGSFGIDACRFLEIVPAAVAVGVARPIVLARNFRYVGSR